MGSVLTVPIPVPIPVLIEVMNIFMAKKTRITRAEYKNLAEALGSAKRTGKISEYKSPAIVARLLLEAFIYEDADINSDWFVREKACTKGTFSKLRDRLVHDGWLHFREDTKRYFPGVRLRPHVQSLKASKTVSFLDLEKKADKDEIRDLDARKVDKKDFARMADDVQDLKAQIHQINALLAELKILQAPPPNAAAQIRSGEIADELDILMKKTGFIRN